jgi:hypothetical protein
MCCLKAIETSPERLLCNSDKIPQKIRELTLRASSLIDKLLTNVQFGNNRTVTTNVIFE